MAENILRISLEVHIHSLIFFTLSKQQKKSHYGAGAYNIKRNQINTQVSKEDIQKNKALGKKSEILPTHFIWRSFIADQMSSVNFYLTSLGSDSQSTSISSNDTMQQLQSQLCFELNVLNVSMLTC